MIINLEPTVMSWEQYAELIKKKKRNIERKLRYYTKQLSKFSDRKKEKNNDL